MSKTKSVVPSVVESTSIASSVDMRLTKSDLVDLLVAERRTELEEAYTKCDAESEALDQLSSIECDRLQKVLEERILKKYGKLIEDFEKLTGLKRGKLERSSNFSSMNSRVLNELPHKMLSFDVTICVQKSYCDDNSNNSRLRFTEKATEKEVQKLVAYYNEWNKARGTMNSRLYIAKQALKELGKTGGKFKIELTKRILNSTKDGQQILANLAAIKKQCVGNALLSSTTETEE